jgi:hypothetical protein
MGDRPNQFPFIRRCKTCPLGTLTSDTDGARTMELEQIELSHSAEGALLAVRGMLRRSSAPSGTSACLPRGAASVSAVG